MKRHTFCSFVFGCRVNQAEKEVIDKQLLNSGFVYSNKNPDIFIINTCTVTHKAEREACQFINQIKRKHPKTKIVVTGCAATKWIHERKTSNKIGILVKNDRKEKTVEIIKSILQLQIQNLQYQPPELKENKPLKDNNFLRFLPISPPGLNRLTPKDKKKFLKLNKSNHLKNQYCFSKYLRSKRLLVKIQDGCQRYCTYCIVPYLRGKPRSKKINALLKEIQKTESYIQEIILTAINTEAFGLDTKESFIDLLKAVISKTAVPRISMGSINPWSVDKNFINFYKKQKTDNKKQGRISQLVDFFHIPIQSGSDKILKLMKRDYTSAEIMKKLTALQKINPLALIATDIIVGFLDETDKDFQDTYNFLKKSPISKFHIFRFSVRKGTAASYMTKKYKEPAEKVKKARAGILRDLGEKKYQKFLTKHIGKTFPALFLDKYKDGYQQALLSNQIPIKVKTRKNLAGKIKQVKVEKEYKNSLGGTFS